MSNTSGVSKGGRTAMGFGANSRRVEPFDGGQELQVHRRARVVKDTIGRVPEFNKDDNPRALLPIECLLIRKHGDEIHFFQIGHGQMMELFREICLMAPILCFCRKSLLAANLAIYFPADR